MRSSGMVVPERLYAAAARRWEWALPSTPALHLLPAAAA